MPGKKKIPECTKLKELYINKKLSMAEIANMYGVSSTAVCYALRKCSLKTRTKEQARTVRALKDKGNKYLSELDGHFFDELDGDSAWVLGVMYACGTAMENDRIDLSLSREKMWVVEKLCTIIGAGRIVWEDNDWDMPKVIILKSVAMRKRLDEIGFPPRKREDYGVPNIPENLMRSFVLGYFTRRGLVSYCKRLMEEIASWLTEMGAGDVTVVGSGEFAIVMTPDIMDIIEGE